MLGDRHYRRARYGWPVKILWALSGDEREPVYVALRRVPSGGPLWFETKLGMTKHPSFDPTHPEILGGPTNEWTSVAYFPSAGCFSLTIQSSAGTYRALFGFGRL